MGGINGRETWGVRLASSVVGWTCRMSERQKTEITPRFLVLAAE